LVLRLKDTGYFSKSVDVLLIVSTPTIQIRVIKGRVPRKEIDFDWHDGGTTTLRSNHTGILHGSDGNDIKLKIGDPHEVDCENEMRTQGYSFKRRL